MKKFRLLLMLMCALLGFSQASAAETLSWGYIYPSKDASGKSQMKNISSSAKNIEFPNTCNSKNTAIGNNGAVTWTCSYTGGSTPGNNGTYKPAYGDITSGYGVLIGSKTNKVTALKFSTTAFVGKKITKVYLFCRTNAGAIKYNLKWTVGSQTQTTSDTPINSTTDAKGVAMEVPSVLVGAGESLTIELVSAGSDSDGGIYLGGLAVEYEDGGSVTPTEPVDPELTITNASDIADGLAINKTFTPSFTPTGLTVTATGNDASIAKYENGVIVPVAVGETDFTFKSAAVENTWLEGTTSLHVKVFAPTPVDPQLGVKNTLTDGKLVVMNGQEETLEFTPEGIKVNAPTGNDPSIATYENGNIVAKGVGTTTFHFTSDAVEYKYTAGEFDLIVEVTEYTQPLTVTFDFVNEDYELTRQSSSSGDYLTDGQVIKNDGITMKFNKGNGNGFRLWGSSSNYYMSVYKNGANFTITAPKGYIFDKMEFTGATMWSVGEEGQGSYANSVWTAGTDKPSVVVFNHTKDGTSNWKTLVVTLKEAPKPVPAIVVSYQGDPMGENDHFTLVKDSELEVLVENAEPAKVTYYILDENVQGATAESGVVENNKFVLDKVGKFRIEFIASDAANTVLASKTVYVIVKGSDTEITSTTYTLDFVNNTYGMMLNPATGSQVGANNNFTGTNTNGLVFFIPKGTNPVSLGNANDGQELKMAQGGEFRVNINNYGQKIAKVEITGSNLDVLTITSNYDAAAEGVMTDGKLVYTPGTDVIARDFVVKYPATRAAGDPVYIKGINVTTAVDTAVEAIDAETAEPVYYDLQGNRVVNPERGIYIKVVGTKATKVLL